MCILGLNLKMKGLLCFFLSAVIFSGTSRKLLIKSVEKVLTNTSIIDILRQKMAQSGEEQFVFDNNQPMAFEKGDRYHYRGVVFERPFDNIPSITVSISGIHSGGYNKIEVSYDNVSLSSFTIVIRAWGDTSIYWLNVSWLAHI